MTIRFLYLGIPTTATLGPDGWEHPLPTVVTMLEANGHDAAKVAERLGGEVVEDQPGPKVQADGIRSIPQENRIEGDPGPA